MSSPLTPCATCSRHVRASVRTCPFCGAACTLPPASGPPGEDAGALSRASITFGGARRAAAVLAATGALGCAVPAYGTPDAGPRTDAPAVAVTDAGIAPDDAR